MVINDLHAHGLLPATVKALVRVPVREVLESKCNDIFTYWDKLRDGRPAPAWTEFHLEHLPPAIVTFVRVVDIERDPFDIRYRFWGTGLVRVLGHDRTGKRLSELPLKRVAQAMAEFRTVVDEREPYALIYNATTSKRAGALYAPAIRLPIMDDEENVTKVVAFTDFNADQAKWRRLLEERS
jgi:hypothetical protein